MALGEAFIHPAADASRAADIIGLEATSNRRAQHAFPGNSGSVAGVELARVDAPSLPRPLIRTLTPAVHRGDRRQLTDLPPFFCRASKPTFHSRVGGYVSLFHSCNNDRAAPAYRIVVVAARLLSHSARSGPRDRGGANIFRADRVAPS